LVLAINQSNPPRIKGIAGKNPSLATGSLKKANTALGLAIVAKDLKILKLLLDKGADPNRPNTQGTGGTYLNPGFMQS
jgi:hypothetical protein